jgi:hypothetical protein
MIKFFQKIRYNLIEKGKTTQYFKYAIGEIFLVVIGILIALQINNWNENKKQRTYEVKMLTEIKNTLESDIDYFTLMDARLKRLDSASNAFLKLVHEKATFDDTLYRNRRSRWYFLMTGINLQFNSGPYEALKSSGLDKVSDDSLRNSLIDFYDFKFPRNIAFIGYYDQGYDEDVETLKSFLGPSVTELVNGKIEVYSKFPEDLFLNPDFLDLLLRIRRRASNSSNIIKLCIKEMEELKTQIKVEVEND